MGYAVTGSSFLGTTSFILLILIKVLFVLFIIGLAVGIAIAIKNYIFTEEDVKRIKCSLSGNNTKEKKICSACGKELGNQWIACPYCGNEIEKEVA